ncbi:hypothetical protein [Dictyobacter halimunensis]|uniref:hypothetical protein n=1 Tax=Dictyobacter halimunensis TaxID=3026934 RepID=UPI0030C6E9F9
MQEAVASPLAGWANFYVIIGSAAAALTGLMFVTVTLIAGLRTRRGGGSINAFGTPNVVHFSVALLIAVTLNAPLACALERWSDTRPVWYRRGRVHYSHPAPGSTSGRL